MFDPTAPLISTAGPERPAPPVYEDNALEFLLPIARGIHSCEGWNDSRRAARRIEDWHHPGPRGYGKEGPHGWAPARKGTAGEAPST